MRRRHYGHGKAQALRWQNFSPGSDQFLVSAAHSADVAVKIIQPQWIDVAVLLTKRGVPVDLIGERVPGKTYCRDADIAQTENIGPFIPKQARKAVAEGKSGSGLVEPGGRRYIKKNEKQK